MSGGVAPVAPGPAGGGGLSDALKAPAVEPHQGPGVRSINGLGWASPVGDDGPCASRDTYGMTYALLAVYWLAVLGLCVFGLNCFVLCWQFKRHRVERTARLAALRADYQARVP